MVTEVRSAHIITLGTASIMNFCQFIIYGIRPNGAVYAKTIFIPQDNLTDDF